MAKVIKSPALQIYHIKAMVPYYEEGAIEMSDESPYRIIAVRPDMSLHELGIAVLDAFDFDDDHLFGFYDNIKRHYSSKVCFEHPQLIEQTEEDWDDFELNKQVYNMDEHCVSDIFTRKGKKWLMLFDYGDEWHFLLSFDDRATLKKGMELPKVIKSKYDAPEQYPDYDEDDE